MLPGVAHHITQRGNNRQDVFFVEDDRRVYLSYLKESAERYGLAVSAYCLMTNHIHLVATPEAEDSLSKTLGRTHLMYAQYVHRLHGRLGHFWQNRFYSCPMDAAHAHHAAAYVELNPVRAGMVAERVEVCVVERGRALWKGRRPVGDADVGRMVRADDGVGVAGDVEDDSGIARGD